MSEAQKEWLTLPEAAELLGIQRAGLWKRIKRHPDRYETIQTAKVILVKRSSLGLEPDEQEDELPW